MTAGRSLPLAALMAALFTGCASSPWQVEESHPVKPLSYSVYDSPTPRSVGKLRRLLLVNTTSPKPEACHGGNSEPPRWTTRDYLVEEKGYDVIYLRKWGDILTESSKAAVALLSGTADKPDAAPAPAAVKQLLPPDQKLDALMLVESGWTCLNAVPGYRWSMAAISLGMSEIMPQGELLKQYRYYRATLFEAATGRAVWQSSAKDPKDSVERALFREIEQAVPALLTR